MSARCDGEHKKQYLYLQSNDKKTSFHDTALMGGSGSTGSCTGACAGSGAGSGGGLGTGGVSGSGVECRRNFMVCLHCESDLTLAWLPCPVGAPASIVRACGIVHALPTTDIPAHP
jgi:hypothetical protein